MNPLDISLTAAYFGKTPPQQLFEYHSNGQVEFHGIAARGIAEGTAAWYITKSAFNGNNQVTSVKVAPVQSRWTDRSSLTYS